MRGKSDLCPLLKRVLLKLKSQESVKCVCPDGSRTPPFIIFLKKRRKMSPLLGDKDRALKNWVFTCFSSGYINGDLKLRWLLELFLPHIAYEERYIILLDEHSSHISFHLVMECIKYGIRLFILPAHTSQQRRCWMSLALVLLKKG